MRQIVAILPFVLMPAAVSAQSFSGPALAIDGDTLDMSGIRVRLHGVDAPETMQTCNRGGQPWSCGRDAGALLADLVAGRTIECTPRDRDAYGRIVATCRVGASDLAAVMAREGMAIALRQYSLEYVEAEARAKAFRMALWGSQFQIPADFRAAHPALFKPPGSRLARRTGGAARAVQPQRAAAWFRNCSHARAAGAAPLFRGRPGYRPEMDRDGDGVACEPYRGRG